jgi:uncharacterized protein
MVISEEYQVLVGGIAVGPLMILDEPLSLWGGLDPVTGLIIDQSHPQLGESMTGRIAVMAHGRGSSSSSTILAEAMRLGTAPAGFILGEPDAILVIGALVGERLYERSCPIVCGPTPVGEADSWKIDQNAVAPTSA